MSETIRFYQTNKLFGFFSNFSRYPISLAGRQWPTSEHYFQSRKFAGTPHEEEVRLATTPMRAAEMGRERARPLRPDWEQVRDEAMREAVRSKFSQHSDLRQALLDTGEAHIIEHTKNDAYWGDAGDGSGQNMLGRILMEVRAELRATGAA